MRFFQKRNKKRSIAIIALALAFTGVCILVVKGGFYSQKVFRLDSTEVDFIRMINGTTGQSIEYQTRVDNQELTDFLNSFRPVRRYPDSLEGRSGFSYSICICINGEEFYYQFDVNRIFVDGYWYIEDGYFSKLTSLLDSMPPQ